MKMELTLAHLDELDFGKVDVAFKQLLGQAVSDCMDRPVDDTARKVGLEFAIKPQPDPQGNCDRVILEVALTCRVPKYRSRVFECQPHINGGLTFNPDTPDDVDQQSFRDLEAKNDDGNDRKSN